MGRPGEPNFCGLCPICKQKFVRNMRCPFCKSMETYRVGIVQNSNGVQKQRYKCYKCRKNWRVPVESVLIKD